MDYELDLFGIAYNCPYEIRNDDYLLNKVENISLKRN